MANLDLYLGDFDFHHFQTHPFQGNKMKFPRLVTAAIPHNSNGFPVTSYVCSYGETKRRLSLATLNMRNCFLKNNGVITKICFGYYWILLAMIGCNWLPIKCYTWRIIPLSNCMVTMVIQGYEPVGYWAGWPSTYELPSCSQPGIIFSTSRASARHISLLPMLPKAHKARPLMYWLSLAMSFLMELVTNLGPEIGFSWNFMGFNF